jgi:RimJ/RimL family protein N-acetyltransferase
MSEVSLRPITEDDLPFLQDLIDDRMDPSPFMRPGFVDPRQWRRRWVAGELVGDNGGIVLIVSGDERAGFIDWAAAQWFGRKCWSIGIQLAASTRGRGIGTTAHKLLVEYLFHRDPINRIEAYTDLDNNADRRALEKAGFTLEGTLRGACFRDGKWRDGVLYSITRP